MIRTATLSDRPDFLRLWAEFMAEQEKEGSHILATTNNLYRMLETFESYVTGGTGGLCLFWKTEEGSPVAVTMVGELPSSDMWDTTFGKTATLWGVYIQPSHRNEGITRELFRHAFGVVSGMGFDSVETYIRADNLQAQEIIKISGGVPYTNHYLVPLRDLKGLENNKAREELSRGDK